MLVRSLIERPEGTRVTVRGVAYHFKENNPGGPHIADVEDRHHLACFLSIPEGYEVVVDQDPVAAVTRSIIAGTAPAEMFDPASLHAGAPAQQSIADPAAVASDLMGQAQTMPIAEQQKVAAAVAHEANAEPDQVAADTATEDAEETPAGQMTEDELHAEELKASYQLVIQDTDNALDTEIDNAFEFLAGRAPNAKAKRETKIDRILQLHQERVAAELNTTGDDDE